MGKINTITILGILLFSIAFLATNFNQQYGLIFGIMSVASFLVYLSDSSRRIEFETNSNNRFQSLLYAVIAYGIFIFASTFAVSALAPQSIVGGFGNSVLKFLAAQAPALADSQLVNFIAFGILTPFIESIFFFGVLMEFIADRQNVLLSKAGLATFKTWALFAVISGIFTFFHLTAKVAQGNVAFITTFLFGMLSCFLVVYFNQLEEAVEMHVTSNSVALAVKYGWLRI